jgi:hypothetical protein
MTLFGILDNCTFLRFVVEQKKKKEKKPRVIHALGI